MRVLIVVTHLLGSGHLARALTLGRAYLAAGHTVTIASGGMPAPHLPSAGLDMLQLPPLRSDGVDFSTLLTDQALPASADYRQSRIDLLLDHLRRLPPDILITELYPFGRRSLRAEFGALLEAAKNLPRAPLICASIRDILAPPSKPSKAEHASHRIAEAYDAVLVHSVAALTPLEASWPVTPQISAKLHYTGYVHAAADTPGTAPPGAGEIIVSAGGGDVGGKLNHMAAAAAALRPDLRWRILVGGKNPASVAAALQKTAPANLTVEPARPDFRQMLSAAKASISMCGYNTALDVLQSAVPAVFIPFDAGGEVEQTLRAAALARQPGIALLKDAKMTPQTLAAALDQVIAAPRRAPLTQGLDGAQNTVWITEQLRGASQ
ncbi:MAG: glycosyltransferase family protein [Sulfitobacter sp.]